jgi:hypothetical protein
MPSYIIIWLASLVSPAAFPSASMRFVVRLSCLFGAEISDQLRKQQQPRYPAHLIDSVSCLI